MKTTEINIRSADYYAAFDFLLDLAIEENTPIPKIDGKRPHDLQAFLKLMPGDKELNARHKERVAGVFSKPQSGYFRTAWNLFHKIRSRESRAKRRTTLQKMAESGALSVLSARHS